LNVRSFPPDEDAQGQLDPDPPVALHQRRPASEEEHLFGFELEPGLASSGRVVDTREQLS
jgi:hypothetical protein